MRKIFTAACTLLLLALPPSNTVAFTRLHARVLQDENDNQNRKVLTAPGARPGRHARGDRKRRRGIRGSYAEAGRSVGRGSKLFARNMARGRPVRAGKEFGKGMGGFGKHVGKGTGKVGKRVGKTTQRAVTP